MIATALTIAGSDSSGGAGVQADLKTFSALGVYGASVITALTAQNTRGVRAVHEVPADFVGAQIVAVLDDIRIDAIKIGMLANASIVEAVAEALADRADTPIVLDPVMAATSGERLFEAQALTALRERLLPMVDVITPNVAEAGVLLSRDGPGNEAEMEVAAADLLALGPAHVLLTGGHLPGSECIDIFAARDRTIHLTAPRAATANTHGGGCTLAAALAAYLARRTAPAQAVRAAKDFVTAAVAAADGLGVGEGRGPVHQFHAVWGRACPPGRA